MKSSYALFLSLVSLALCISTLVVPAHASYLKHVGSYEIEWSAYESKYQIGGGRWRFVVNIKVTNRANTTIHIPWFYVYFYNVTYMDGTSEDYGISANFTANYAIEPNRFHYVSVNFTQLGFPKEPKERGIEYAVLIYIAEAASSLEIWTIDGVPILEFSAKPILALAVTLAVALLAIQTRTRPGRLSRESSKL